MRNKIIRVLIVDDSAVFRQVISKGISLDPSIQVVATAVDAFDARDKIIEFDPDVITCDIEMPKMDGLSFVKKLMPQYPKPVVMVSSLNNVVFDVMNAGAVDFVGKPDATSPESVQAFVYELIHKVKCAASSKRITSTIEDSSMKEFVNSDESCRESFKAIENRVIAVGASTGGTEALTTFIKQLPNTIPGMVVVQHIPPKFSKMFAERLDGCCSVTVREAKTGDYIEQGVVLIAPGDRHMRVVRVGDKFKIECFFGEKVSGHCPSVDVLFDSVAKTVGKDAIGVILTGMGCDGARGLLNMKRKGAITMGQDEQTSVVYGMPRAAFEIGAVQKQLPLTRMAFHLVTKLREK